ncbi:MAG TPA: glucoamylase family protein [Ohtaekwangia sp.]
MFRSLLFVVLVFVCAFCSDDPKEEGESLRITSFKIDGEEITTGTLITDVNQNAVFTITFSAPVDPDFVTLEFVDISGNEPLQFLLSPDQKQLTVTPAQPMVHLSRYLFWVSSTLKGTDGEMMVSDFSQYFYTELDPTPKQPVLPNDEDTDNDNTNDLLSVVQQQTFKYFWDFAHPASGMARERNTSGNTVTSGGSGFGIMSIIVGMERDFITRAEGIARMNKIVSFLETADRFHGAWSHWMDGNTGDVIPFSTKDNGGDLVETSFLVQGLITFRQYLEPSDTVGNNLINRINTLWEEVEWDWYRKNNENVLYWHWSPNYNWDMNFALYGYFEEQVTYFLAAASPTHSIPKIVYSNGYGRNGAIKTGNTYYGYVLPLGTPSPLFWVHYSYLGMDPHFTDDYADYWQQNVNASLINHAYCAANPRNFVGYSDECWGLTSSDNQNGYGAHSPANDIGVITPTAALSSFPYTPTESMKALKFFYYTIGDRLWGPYGFYDAFNITEGWTASSYLAIDQGPIIVMIENYRTGLLWDLFMSAPEAQEAAAKLNFTY